MLCRCVVLFTKDGRGKQRERRDSNDLTSTYFFIAIIALCVYTARRYKICSIVALRVYRAAYRALPSSRFGRVLNTLKALHPTYTAWRRKISSSLCSAFIVWRIEPHPPRVSVVS